MQKVIVQLQKKCDCIISILQSILITVIASHIAWKGLSFSPLVCESLEPLVFLPLIPQGFVEG